VAGLTVAGFAASCDAWQAVAASNSIAPANPE
jgi:hypothetical protein